MHKVNRLRGAAKGAKVDVLLAEKVLIIGAVGSGKSRIVDVLHLAAGESYPDALGRASVAQAGRLELLGTEDGPPWGIAELSPGAAGVSVGHLATVRGVVVGDAARFRAWIGQQAKGNTRDYGVEIRTAEAAVRAARADVAAAERVSQAIRTAPSTAAVLADEEVEALQAIVTVMTENLAGAPKKSLDDLADAVQAATEALAKAKAARSEKIRVELARAAINLLAHRPHEEKCPLCAGPITLERAESVTTRARAAIPAKLIAAALTVESAQEAFEEANAALAAATEWADKHFPATVEEYRAELLAARTKLSAHEDAVKVRKGTTEAAKDTRKAASQALADAQVRLAEIKREAEEAAQEAVGGLQRKASAYLPGVSLVIDVDKGHLGFEAGGKTRWGLSGVEYEEAVMALALATLPDDNKAHVLIPADRAWDGATLRLMCEKWRHAPAQIVIATTVEPAGPTPGWSILSPRAAVRGEVEAG